MDMDVERSTSSDETGSSGVACSEVIQAAASGEAAALGDVAQSDVELGEVAQGETASRRGTASLRNRTLDAFNTTCFPPFPSVGDGETDFDLPRGLIDAPLSAKRDLAHAAAGEAAQDFLPLVGQEVIAKGSSPAGEWIHFHATVLDISHRWSGEIRTRTNYFSISG